MFFVATVACIVVGHRCKVDGVNAKCSAACSGTKKKWRGTKCCRHFLSPVTASFPSENKARNYDPPKLTISCPKDVY